MAERQRTGHELRPEELNPLAFQDAVSRVDGQVFYPNVLNVPRKKPLPFMERGKLDRDADLSCLAPMKKIIPEGHDQVQTNLADAGARVSRILADIYNLTPYHLDDFQEGIPHKRWHGLRVEGEGSENELLAAFGSPEGVQLYILGQKLSNGRFIGASLAFDHTDGKDELRYRRRLRHVGLGQFSLPDSKELIRVQTGVVMSPIEGQAVLRVLENGREVSNSSWAIRVRHN